MTICQQTPGEVVTVARDALLDGTAMRPRELGIGVQKSLQCGEIDTRIERIIVPTQAVRTHAAHEQFFFDAIRVATLRQAQKELIVFADAETFVESANEID